MTRHYIEGLVFALLALYTYTQHLERPSAWRLALSVAFYALAAMCKETYVPLVLLLPFLPRGSVDARLRSVIPFILVAVLYVLWRSYMLQSLFGGHAGILQIDFLFVRAVASAFLNIPMLLFPSFYVTAIFLCLATVLAGVILGGARSWLLLIVPALALAPLAPLVVVPGIMQPDRYLLLPWAGLSFALPCLTARFCGSVKITGFVPKTAAVSALIALAGVSLLNSRQYLGRVIHPVATEFDAHAEFLLSHGDSTAFVPGTNVLANFWFVNGLRDILPHIENSHELPTPIVDPLWFDASQTSVFFYDANCGCMLRTSDDNLAQYADSNATVQEEPLHIEMQFGQEFLHWQLGPYHNGEYRLVSQNIGSLFLPQSGSIPTTLQTLQLLESPFVLKYSSPHGWIPFSPELTLDTTESANSAGIKWERP